MLFAGGWSAKVTPFYRVTRNQILNAPDFFFGFPFIGSTYVGENYYPYAPFSVNPATQYTMAVSVKI